MAVYVVKIFPSSVGVDLSCAATEVTIGRYKAVPSIDQDSDSSVSSGHACIQGAGIADTVLVVFLSEAFEWLLLASVMHVR